MNKGMLIGVVNKVYVNQDGKFGAWAKLTIKVTTRNKDFSTGEFKNATNYFDVSKFSWGKGAYDNSVVEGSLVYVEYTLTKRTDENGVWFINLNVTSLVLLDASGASANVSSPSPSPSNNLADKFKKSSGLALEEDVPF